MRTNANNSTTKLCPHCSVPLAPGTVHHLRRQGPTVTVCRVIDVDQNFAELISR